MSAADALIARLDLKPHPEGGHFKETFRDCGPPPAGRDSNPGRAHSTAIYFLLKAGEHSHWHRIDAAEVWHYYRGAPLELRIGKQTYVLGPDIERGEAPQLIVPPGAWQAARSLGNPSLGDYTLVGCTVAPGFEFSKFEMAPDNFEPL